MMQNKQRASWVIAAGMFGGFLLTFWLDLTGLALHQWLGVALGVLAGYHVAVHWRWVTAVTQRFFGRTSRQAKAFYVVDVGLAAGFGAILVTGLVISSWLDLGQGSYEAWRAAHVAASVATLALVVVKIGLHWRWIVATARRHIWPAPAPVAGPASGISMQRAAVATSMSRREFVRLMGGVGAVALLAGVNALGGLEDGGQTAEASATTLGTGNTRVWKTAEGVVATAACTVRCGRRCSYPGHCRRYRDTNGNGRCDLGECVS